MVEWRGLEVLPLGRDIDDLPELLSGDRFVRLLDELSVGVDYLLVSAPSAPSPAGVAVGRVTSGVLLVGRELSTTAGEIDDVAERAELVGAESSAWRSDRRSPLGWASRGVTQGPRRSPSRPRRSGPTSPRLSPSPISQMISWPRSRRRSWWIRRRVRTRTCPRRAAEHDREGAGKRRPRLHQLGRSFRDRRRTGHRLERAPRVPRPSHRPALAGADRPTSRFLQRWSGQRFAVLPSASRPSVAVPLTPRPVAAAAVRTFKQSGDARSRALLRMLGQVTRLGLLRLWPHQIILDASPPSTEHASEPGDLSTYLDRVLGGSTYLAVYASPPRSNRKPVVQLIESSGRIHAYVKISVSPLTASLVRNEGQVLEELQVRRSPTVLVPRVLHRGVWQGRDILVQSALTASGEVTPARLRAAMIEVCATGERETVDLAENGYVQSLFTRLDALSETRGGPLRAALQDIVGGGHQQGSRLALGAWHGDWTPWNMGASGEQVAVWDWERYEVGVPVGYDAVHHEIQRAVVRGGVAPIEAARSAVQRAAELLDGFGLDGHQARLTSRLYLVEIGTRYETDGQRDNGARLGELESWLLPVLDESRVGRGAP